MNQTDKCVVAQVLKVVVIINLIIIDHSRMIQAFRIIEISKYDDGGQLTTRGQLMQGSSTRLPASFLILYIIYIYILYIYILTELLSCISGRGILQFSPSGDLKCLSKPPKTFVCYKNLKLHSVFS